MREYFYPLDGRKHYKDLEEIQKDMFQAFKNLNNEIFEKESPVARSKFLNLLISFALFLWRPYYTDRGIPLRSCPYPTRDIFRQIASH